MIWYGMISKVNYKAQNAVFQHICVYVSTVRGGIYMLTFHHKSENL